MNPSESVLTSGAGVAGIPLADGSRGSRPTVIEQASAFRAVSA